MSQSFPSCYCDTPMACGGAGKCRMLAGHIEIATASAAGKYLKIGIVCGIIIGAAVTHLAWRILNVTG